MKVPTKTLAFTDPTAVANDRLTGETSIVAFRATALKNGDFQSSYSTGRPCIGRLLLGTFFFVILIRIS